MWQLLGFSNILTLVTLLASNPANADYKRCHDNVFNGVCDQYEGYFDVGTCDCVSR